ncbi:MAG: DUF1858 domain-containing protein [Bacteroidetes bacterium]|nr:DUF1858 domain-containing protein [Bacteroidota bacterium]
MKENTLIISPKTKVLHLIETYPELEEVLIELVPAFTKLRNPVLRKTVARITTLQQAAQVGQIELELLINRLRAAVGQDALALDKASVQAQAECPDWVKQFPLYKELDARPMLEAGEHPVGQVLEDLKQMPSGYKYLLIAPFLPAPLIDKAKSLGAMHHAEQSNPQTFKVYFRM